MEKVHGELSHKTGESMVHNQELHFDLLQDKKKVIQFVDSSSVQIIAKFSHIFTGWYHFSWLSLTISESDVAQHETKQ